MTNCNYAPSLHRKNPSHLLAPIWK
ncbi:hypothetical protein M3J09_011197 [Ascochyta lentis]